jgi:CMP-N,N'-diacetyllegionaminic acid synthase
MINDKKLIAIIPARGGSKRLPNKNILQLTGKPLIAWTVEAALSSDYIDKVIVSTDSQKISQIAQNYGADSPFLRPPNLSTDTASTLDVVYHALTYFNNDYDYVMVLQPTSPLRTSNDIDNAIRLFSSDIKSVISVCEVDHSPLWSNTLPENHSMENFLSAEVNNKRSQDLPTYYRLNGAIYASEIEYLKNHEGFYGDKTIAYVMARESSVDIDNAIDFKLCDILLKDRVL